MDYLQGATYYPSLISGSCSEATCGEEKAGLLSGGCGAAADAAVKTQHTTTGSAARRMRLKVRPEDSGRSENGNSKS